MTTPFETILKTTPPSISEDWLQGRTSFGGILVHLHLKTYWRLSITIGNH